MVRIEASGRLRLLQYRIMSLDGFKPQGQQKDAAMSKRSIMEGLLDFFPTAAFEF
jgi:hypothetical protein